MENGKYYRCTAFNFCKIEPLYTNDVTQILSKLCSGFVHLSAEENESQAIALNETAKGQFLPYCSVQLHITL